MAGEGGLANEIRAGLEVAEPFEIKEGSLGELHPVLDTRWMGKRVRDHVADFGAVFCLISVLVGAYLLYRGVSYPWVLFCLLLGAGFYEGGKRAPLLMHPLWKGWMAVAEFIALVVNFIILSTVWTIVLLPTAILLKVISKRVMDTTFDRSVKSYWEEREEKYHDFKLLERQF